MKSLLIIAHGSRRAASNDDVRQLAERISKLPSTDFDEVSAAFLELAEPSIPDDLEACIQRGATEVVVFPYFLAAGRHVVEEISRMKWLRWLRNTRMLTSMPRRIWVRRPRCRELFSMPFDPAQPDVESQCNQEPQLVCVNRVPGSCRFCL